MQLAIAVHARSSENVGLTTADSGSQSNACGYRVRKLHAHYTRQCDRASEIAGGSAEGFAAIANTGDIARRLPIWPARSGSGPVSVHSQ